MTADFTSTQMSLHWLAVTGCEAPKALNGILLEAALAYEQQCKDHGTLSLSDRKRLHKVARSIRQANGATNTPIPSRATLASPPKYAFGTQFVREWKGQDEVVTVTNDGFFWDGQTYKSLSAVARAITGTRWNGPRFFGLKSNRKAR